MKTYSHLIIFFTLTLLIGASGFGIYFFHQKVQGALDAGERLKLEQEIQEEQIRNLPELSSLYNHITESESYFSLLYPEDRVVEIIKDIERVAKEQGVALTITQKEIPKKKATPKEKTESKEGEEKAPEKPKELVETLPYEKHIRLELKAEGSYQAVRNFLNVLETAPYALDVLTLTGTLAPPEEGTTERPKVGTPFLLEGSAPPEEQKAASTGKVVFLIETALYTQ